MAILYSLLKGIGAFFVLSLIGSNLIGMIVRGFISPELKNSNEVSRQPSKSINFIITLFSFLLTLIVLYVLYKYFSVGIMVSALVIMLARIPDLIYEIRSGKKISRYNMPKKPLDIICTIAYWLSLLLLCYSFYLLESSKK